MSFRGPRPRSRRRRACRRYCRRGITADQIVPIRGEDRAADARRGRPHHLRVVGDVLPLAGTADRREDAGLQQELFAAPQIHHLFGRHCPVPGPHQVLALAGASLARRMNEWPRLASTGPYEAAAPQVRHPTPAAARRRVRARGSAPQAAVQLALRLPLKRILGGRGGGREECCACCECCKDVGPGHANGIAREH